MAHEIGTREREVVASQRGGKILIKGEARHDKVIRHDLSRRVTMKN